MVLAGAREDARREEQAARDRLVRTADPVELASIGWELHEVRARLARLGAVAAALDAPGRALLDLEVDPRADAGAGVRAAVARGDVDAAAHVGVFTAGFTTGVDELPGRLGELDALAAAAGPGTAAVAWYGYDAPQVHEVGDPDRSVLGRAPADEGAPRLASFLDGLDAARPGREAHVTAIGHSYGSVVTAAAVAPGAAEGVDDVVYLGSPGVGEVPGRPPGHAWVVEAAGDPVADTAWFGPDPTGCRASRGSRRARWCCPTGGCWPSHAATAPTSRRAPRARRTWPRWWVVGRRTWSSTGGSASGTGCGAWWAGEPGARTPTARPRSARDRGRAVPTSVLRGAG